MGRKYITSRTKGKVKSAVKRTDGELNQIGQTWEGHKWKVRLIRNEPKEKLYEVKNTNNKNIYRVNRNIILGGNIFNVDAINQSLRKGQSDLDSEKTEKALQKLKE